MTDSLPTTWPLEPHTKVKHQILDRYLKAWFPILAQQARLVGASQREILFIDGFAGPGEYSDGQPGSPIIALTTAIDHKIKFPSKVRMLFIEHRPDRFSHLKRIVAPLAKNAASSLNVRAVHLLEGDCDSELSKILSDFETKKVRFGPALAFLDQFGYGAVTMDLIRRILAFDECEVFTYLSYKEMNRWITDPNKADAFTRAFGGDEWRECVAMPENQRRQHLLAKYKQAIRLRAKAAYIVSFLMFDHKNQPLYWLLFCTNNIRGLEEMKKAMWSVDSSGEFRFSDRVDPSQLSLLEVCFSQDWLAGELKSTLKDRTMSALEVKEFVLTETPCYLFKLALKSLEKGKRITILSAPPGRATGAFPDDSLNEIVIQFDGPGREVVRELF